MNEDLNLLVRTGFRPANLPPKSPLEKERHLAHVSAVISNGGSKIRIGSRFAKDTERRALDALWRTELMTGPALILTDQMKRLWEEYGLPSQFVRSVVWPWSACGFSLIKKDELSREILSSSEVTVLEDVARLIEIDVKRTLPFLGFHLKESNARESKCINVLKLFALLHPEIGYTQGMSYVCVRLMMELEFDEPKTLVCLQRILLRSPTVACMYRLNLTEIKHGAEFVLDSIAWENVPRLWMHLKSIKFATVDWFFLEWILTMFVKNFPIKISAFVLDLFFLSGDIVLYKAAIAALSQIEDEIISQTDLESVRGFIGRIGDKIESESFVESFHEIQVPQPILDFILAL